MSFSRCWLEFGRGRPQTELVGSVVHSEAYRIDRAMNRPFPEDRERSALTGAFNLGKPGVAHQGPRVSQNVEDGHFKQELLLAHSFVRPVGGWRSVRPLDRHLQLGYFSIVHGSLDG